MGSGGEERPDLREWEDEVGSTKRDFNVVPTAIVKIQYELQWLLD